MAYTRAWDEAVPNGATTNANTIDTEIQNVKVDLRERLATAFGLSGASEFDDDPFVVKSMAFAQGTITADAQVFSCTATWNNGAVTFTAIKLNVTNTASAAASKLIDLQVGGVSQLALTRAGALTITGGLVATTGTFSSTISIAGTASLSTSGIAVVGAAALAGTASLIVAAATGNDRQVIFRTGSTERWTIKATATAESGSDAGSNFGLNAYTDAGALIDTPIVINRAAAGTMTLARPVLMSSTLDVTGALTVTSATGLRVDSATSAYAILDRGASTDDAGLIYRTAASSKFFVGLRSSSGENFQIFGYTVAANIITITDATGAVTISTATTLSSTLAVTGAITGSSSVNIGAAASLTWTGRSIMHSSVDGIITVANNAGTAFQRLTFGGTTSSFPALRRTSATLDFVLADNTEYAGFRGSIVTLGVAAEQPSTVGNVRLPNNTSIAWRNVANSGNHTLTLNASDSFVISSSLTVTTGNTATAGDIRLLNNAPIGWRNAANSANHTLTLNGSDVFALTAGLAITGNLSVSTSISATTTITAGTGLTVTTGGITVTGNSTITGTLGGVTTLAISNTITSTIGSITSSRPAWSSTATFNAGGATFTHIFANITDTASALGSDLIDLQAGGVSQFSVSKTASGFWPINAVALSIANHASSTVDIVAGANANHAVSLSFSGAITASKPLLSMAQTWNSGAVEFSAILLNVTNTASVATSKLIDLQVGGSSQFNVTRAGVATIAGGLNISSGQFVLTSAATNIFIINELSDPTNEFGISHDGAGEWTIRSGVTNTDPLVLASGSLHFNNGTPFTRPNYDAATGTATRTTFATGTVTLPDLAERVKAMIDDFISFGLFT